MRTSQRTHLLDWAILIFSVIYKIERGSITLTVHLFSGNVYVFKLDETPKVGDVLGKVTTLLLFVSSLTTL